MSKGVNVVITGDTKKLSGALGNAEKDLKGFGGKVKGFGGQLGGLAGGLGKVAGPMAAVFAGGQLLDFGGELFNLGQKLDVYQKKASTVFEGAAGSVRKWADANNEAMGLSDDELVGLAAGFGDLLKPMGFTAEQAGKMSTEVVGLSGALSAWSGGQKSAAEVSEILSAAMLGETDGLKALGIAISQDEINAKLAAEGKDKLTGAALNQAKALATQQLIMEKSTDAQKAWSDGSMDGMKNTNTLKATFEDLKATLAEKLMPIASKLTSWLVKEAVPAMGRLFTSGKQIWAEWSPKISSAVKTIWDRAQPIFKGIQDAWNTVVGWFKSGSDDIGKKGSWLGDTISKIGGLFSSVFGAIQAVISTVVSVVTTIWDNFGDIIMDTVSGIWDGLKTTFGGILDMLTGVFDLIKAVLSGKWGDAWTAIKKILSGAWNVILGLLKGAWAQISGIFSVAGRLLSAAWGALWDLIKRLLGAAKDWILGKFNELVAFVKSIPGRIAAIGRTMWEGIKATIGAVKDFVIGRFNALMSFVTGLPGRVRKAVSGLWDGIKNGVNAAKAWVLGKLDSLVKWVVGLPGRIRSAVSGMWDGIKDAFKGALNWVIRKWNKFGFTFPTVTVPIVGKVGGWKFNTPNIPEFHAGGVVPGRPGSEVIAKVLAGETIRTQDQEAALWANSGGSPARITVQLVLSGNVRHRSDAEWLAENVEDMINRGLTPEKLRKLIREIAA